MALVKELLNILDNPNEPLNERLKIADNAFYSIELPIQHREAVLLKWLVKATKSNHNETWNLLLRWLNSQQIQVLSRNDISRQDLRVIMHMLIKRSKYFSPIFMDCINALIGNRNFQLFFKYDIKEYCLFMSSILCRNDDVDVLHRFISNEQLLNRNLILNEEFYGCFLEHVLPSFDVILNRFPDNTDVFREMSTILQKCLFHRNFKNFSLYLKSLFKPDVDLKEKLSFLPKMLIIYLQNHYNENIYKLIFHSYCTSFDHNFEMIFQFFVILVEILGFNMSNYFEIPKFKKFNNITNVDVSLQNLTNFLEILTKIRVDLSLKIREKSFTDFLQILTVTIIHLTRQPSLNSYKFLNNIILLDPFLMEKNLSQILLYVTSRIDEKFLISLFEVFAKLHRVPNLISKVIRTMKSASEGEVPALGSVLEFAFKCEQPHNETVIVTEILPPVVLDYLTQCITGLASWQVMNLFKTLLFHLDAAISTDITIDGKTVYVELVSMLMCQFLLSVRITEHAVPTAIVKKFVNGLNELKDILGKFGNALVNMEHNPPLMKAYLSICHAWGDVYIALTYYSINNEVTFQKSFDSDSSACNITYLHSYLTRDQWCLISQRIANFGEKPCKQIMQKLYIQKLRVLLLFEETVTDEVLTAIRTAVVPSLDDNWRDVVNDELVLSEIVTKSHNLARISELVLEDVIETGNFESLQNLYDHKKLLNSMLYTCLYKLNKAFKRKTKWGQSTVRISLSSKVFPNISENCSCITKTFIKEILIDTKQINSDIISSINEKQILDYMEIMQKLPIAQFDNPNTQEMLFLYLVCIYLDLKSSILQNCNLITKCESLIIGVAQCCTGSFEDIIEPFAMTKVLINSLARYSEIFACIMQHVLKNENCLKRFDEGINFLAEHVAQERYRDCVVIILNNIYKYKKSKGTTEYKNLLVSYQEKLCLSVIELVKSKKGCNDMVCFTEVFALSLKYSLTKESDDGMLRQLATFVLEYINIVINEQNIRPIKGGILLLIVVIRNKSKLRDIHDDVVLKAWNCIQNVTADDRKSEDYAQLVMLIFEHIPNEQFQSVSSDLLKSTTDTIEADPKLFAEQLSTWNSILACHFNPIKMKVWQDVVILLLHRIVMNLNKHLDNSVFNDLVEFEIGIIQNLHFLLSAPIIELILTTVSILNSSSFGEFTNNFDLCALLLENLLKFRKPITMDYLQSYLQRYRALLNKLCVKSNSDLKLNPREVQKVADCAHKLEKLTNSLVACNRPLVRISFYLVADILKQYEEVTLYPNVKIHLNNCLYSLISLCDHHATAYLMRTLSTASTEMFKVVFKNYKKYYKFTGKV